ncbi:hypothetical protein CANCADRAFT_1711 [Tortispora caseinolytica NRRL Y-17796]|uniref:peptidyl-tRNA hydrolase n=1 Tax=Tortispora caseinolytica NRRL Y-17796 TaxID=767744 RepID=A0A1E4TE06_9ASCO|nr:hypothetical protein CANCADRAFT_1711 [Tortispora caseinolytica NRRL Y-17796]
MSLNGSLLSGLVIGLGSGYLIARLLSSSASGVATIDEGSVDEGGYPLSIEEYKMVLVVRTDLHMERGKAAAQCAHAAVACYKASCKSSPAAVRLWEVAGQPKIALKTDSEESLELLYAKALSLNITARIIHDAGRTQVAPNTATVIGIGPAPKSLIDQVTGSLKLY